MQKLFVILISLFLISCSSKLIPLKGSYAEPPYQITSSKNFQQVWDNLVDLFAQKGLSIKIIDKSSGLITSDRSILKTTIEKKDGSLQNPEAFIVLPQIYEPGPNRYVPLANGSDVVGEWNVRIKEINEVLKTFELSFSCLLNQKNAVSIPYVTTIFIITTRLYKSPTTPYSAGNKV